jgi:hypothetical protein
MKKQSKILMVILPVLACFALSPGAHGVCQDGCGSNFNTFQGDNALISLGVGAGNTGVGWYSLFFTSATSFNTGLGAGTLALNNSDDNTAIGAGAMLLNTSGSDNVAVGTDALLNNDGGADNNAIGSFALFSNINGTFNNAHGRDALFDNLGSQNNAFGDLALESNTTGGQNTAVGDDALDSCTTGNSNTALGDEAGTNLIDGEGNIYIGAQVNQGSSGEFEFIRIGNDTAFTFPYDTFIAGIFSRSVSMATAQFVFVDDTGKLGTNLVDANGNKVATPQAMLDESLKQTKRIAELEGTVERLAAMVKEQAAQIQRVSAQLEVSKPAAKVVVNKP